MVPKSGHPVTVETWKAPETWKALFPGEDGYVRMAHVQWPGLRFVVTFNAEASVTGFTVERDPDGPMLTAKRFQRIPYGALERTAFDFVSSWTAAYSRGRSKALADDPYSDHLGSGVHRLSRAFVDKQYTGRRGRNLAEYAAVAARYVALVKSGSTSPIKDLAVQLGEETGEYLSDARIRNIIFECRNRCLLTAPPKAGMGGGELTKKALALLRHDEGEE